MPGVCAEYGLAYKVTETHLNVSGQQRVKYASQLLSKTCANSIKYLGEKGLLVSKNWKQTADFLTLTDEWFDVMNSSIFSDKKERCAYGIHIETQTNVLLKMMSTMKVNNSASGSVCNFQKGIVLSSHSLMGLYVMLKENFNIEFMTRKLNQDCIRQMSGPHDHPDCHIQEQTKKGMC